MNELKTLTEDRLRPIIETFSTLEWPISREQVKAIADDLDWVVTSGRKKGVGLSADMAEKDATIHVLLREDKAAEITIPLSESARHHNAIQRDMSSTFRLLSDGVASVLGSNFTRAPGIQRYHWDLGNESRLAVERLTHEIVLLVLSPWVANIEREEERQGLDPSRPIGDHQESNL
ncbi:hypothetical protein J2Y69_000078 [Microbacterium resistens]|uniref:Uncharacterized protein n=1 Tax=Microbacterium resistens TaxID=156977 RepID=A0ABU1S797_9MICO|nr:DUF6301 family protein [Microbacterium resistens]MDR6865496.1 hypothetical protein [Microbacterium resistens]